MGALFNPFGQRPAGTGGILQTAQQAVSRGSAGTLTQTKPLSPIAQKAIEIVKKQRLRNGASSRASAGIAGNNTIEIKSLLGD